MNTYFGSLEKQLAGRTVTIGEYSYPSGYRIDRHSHAAAYLSVVLQGEYRETVDRSENQISGPTVIVHRPGESHHDVFGTRGATILSIDMPADWFQLLLERSRTVYIGHDVRAAIARVARAAKADHAASEWFLESAVLHLVGTMLHQNERLRSDPPWLPRLTAYLHDTYSRNTPLSDLAAIAQVHPVSMARQFQKKHRCTIGAYVRSLRIERALRDLADGRKPIAEIAAEHGFSDQSHLTRHLRLATGMTPARWRARNGPQGEP
jgi:AraC family transcriptional regulator